MGLPEHVGATENPLCGADGLSRVCFPLKHLDACGLQTVGIARLAAEKVFTAKKQNATEGMRAIASEPCGSDKLKSVVSDLDGMAISTKAFFAISKASDRYFLRQGVLALYQKVATASLESRPGFADQMLKQECLAEAVKEFMASMPDQVVKERPPEGAAQITFRVPPGDFTEIERFAKDEHGTTLQAVLAASIERYEAKHRAQPGSK